MQTQKMKFISFWLLVMVVVAAVVGLRPWQPVSADPLQVAGGGCYQIFLPLIMGSELGVSATAVNSGIITPPASDPCDSAVIFPDFNGDGYADLVIGVPQEDVTQGVTYANAGAAHVIYGTDDGLMALAAQAAVDDQLWHRAISGLDEIAPADDDNFGQAFALGDFNNDGYDDLAIGVPGSVVNGHDEAGAVQVLYGTAVGLTTTDSQTWTQESLGVDDSADAGDHYGAALTAGDFDADGYDDLAVGIPGETVDGFANAGAMNIIFGASGGLRSTIISGGKHDEFLSEDSDPFFGLAELNDQFAHALTNGDFNGDGYQDIAVSIPYEDFAGGLDNAGNVQIFFGTADGFWHNSAFSLQPQQISANTTGVDNLQEVDEYFGYSLSAADYDDDGYDDLAVGTPYETHGAGGGAILYAGAVNIVFGSSTGLDAAAGAPIWHQGLSELDSEPTADELFGWSLSSADFDHDGYADLAVGVPGEKVLTVAIGATHILYGSASGPTGDGDRLIYDPDNPELLDRFGFAVTAADFNGDGFADLAVGAYQDDPTDLLIDNVGSVFVFHSDAAGVSQTDNQNWYQGHNGVAGAPEISDGLGSHLP